MKTRLDDFELTELGVSINRIEQKAAQIAKDGKLFSSRVEEHQLEPEVKREESARFLKKFFPSYLVIFREVSDLIRKGYIEGVIDEKDGEVAADIDEVKNTIVTCVVGDVFIAKTPLAMHQYKRKVVNRKGALVDVSYDWTYGRILREIIFDNMKYIPGYRDKNVSILHVCSEDAQYIPDTNNRDIKTLIDAVTLPFAGRDGAENCSNFSATVRASDIKEGTYLIVNQGFGVVPGIEKLKSYCRLVEGQTDPFMIHLNAVIQAEYA